MDQGKFEDSIKSKFDGQTKKAPVGVWGNIENALNAELVSVYAAKQTMYKWVSVAAVLIAVVLFGILNYPVEIIGDDKSQELSYNALLSNDIDYDKYYHGQIYGFDDVDFTFQPFANQKGKETNNGAYFEQQQEVYPYSVQLEGKRPSLALANFSKDIYRYRSSSSIPRRIKEESVNKMWAGVEAGAGNFNSGLGSSGTLSNSLNPTGLASAVGSASFINPTTNVSQSMNDAIATSIGIDFGVQMGKKWTLESGIAYTAVENSGVASINVLDVYTIDNNNFIEQSNDGLLVPGSSVGARETTLEVRENYDHEIDIKNSVQFASIPVKAGYFLFQDKFSLRVNAGLSANYLVEGNVYDPSRQVVNGGENLYNEWSFDGIGGLEFGYSIFNKFDLTVEPNYRHALTPISTTSNSPSRFAVQTGLRYTLK